MRGKKKNPLAQQNKESNKPKRDAGNKAAKKPKVQQQQ